MVHFPLPRLIAAGYIDKVIQGDISDSLWLMVDITRVLLIKLMPSGKLRLWEMETHNVSWVNHL